MTSTLTDLLRRLEQHLLSSLRLLSPADREALLSGLSTLLARCRVAAPDQWTGLHQEFEALFTRTHLNLPPLRITRTGGLESFTSNELHTRGQANLFERIDAIEQLVRGVQPVQPKPRLATLYPDARAPKQVALDQPFSIEAQICGAPPTPQPKHVPALQALPGPDGRVHVRVFLLPGDGLRLRSPADAELSVFPGQDSHVLAFRVQATRPGPLRAQVLFQAGTTSATIDLELTAAKVATSTHTTRTTTLALTPTTADLHLTVIRLADVRGGLGLRLLLHDRGSFVDSVDAVLSDVTITTLHERVTTLGDRLGQIDREGWEVALRNFGRNLAANLLRNLRDVFQRPRPAGTRVFVQSSEPELPLELCLLRIDGKDVFLGEHYAVTHASLGPAPPATFRARPAVLASRTADQFDLASEESALRSVAVDVDHATRFVDVLRRLDGDPLGILHLALHGHIDPHRPGSAGLSLEGGELVPELIPRSEPDRRTAIDGGLVFLNACRAGAAQRMLAREGGLIDAFHRTGAGAAAVLAPLWSVDSNVAGLFAAHVYNAVAAGTPLDEALRRARIALPHEPDRLAYVLHAAPGCRPEHRSAST